MLDLTSNHADEGVGEQLDALKAFAALLIAAGATGTGDGKKAPDLTKQDISNIGFALKGLVDAMENRLQEISTTMKE